MVDNRQTEKGRGAVNCMKCGREISEGAFCEECLAGMEKYPVKPNIVVQIPNRQEAIQAKKMIRRRKELTEKEKLIRYERRVRILIWINGILAICLAGALVLCLMEYRKTLGPPTGQNYTSVTPSTQAAGE